MPLTAKLDTSQKTLALTFSGRFDYSLHQEFRAGYKNADKTYAVIINLKDTEYMDSAALGMLLLLCDEFPVKRPVISDCTDYVKQILHIARFEKRFDIV